jgi:TolB-like protein
MSILVALLVVGMVPGAVAQQQQLTPVPAEQQDQRPEATAPPAVLVLPFTMLGDDGKHDWVGQGIQQNLQAELGRAGLELVGTLQIKPMNRAPVIVRPEDEIASALKMGAEAKADVVIFGNYQVVEDELRVTGRVMDVASGQNVGFLKGSGTMRSLLALEDELAKQAMAFFQAVPEGEAAAQQQQQAATEPTTAVAEPVVQQQEPQIFQPTTEVVYSPRYYDDDIDDYDWIGAATYVYPTYYPVEYYYPSYSYYYKPYCYRPWYWSSFSFGFHHGHHHHHYHHRHHGYYREHRDHHVSVIDRHRWDRGDRYRPGRNDDRDDRFRRDGDSVRGRTTIVALDRNRDDARRLTSVGYRDSSSRHAQYVSGRKDTASSSMTSRLRSNAAGPTLAYRRDRYDKGTTTVKREPVKVVSPTVKKDVAVVKKDDKPAASDDSKKVVRVNRDPFSSRDSRGTRDAVKEPVRDVKREAPPRQEPRRESVREPSREPSRVAQRDPSPSRSTERAPSRSESPRSSSGASSRRESAPPVRSSPSNVRSSGSGRSVAAVSSRGSDSGSRSSSVRGSSAGRDSGSSFRSSSSSSSSSRSSGSSSSSSRSGGGGGGGSSRGGGGSRGR